MSERKVATSTVLLVCRDVACNVSCRHQHHSKLCADAVGIGKDAHDFIRRSAGSHVVVSRLPAKQNVAHASAHEIGLVALLAQGTNDRDGEIFSIRAVSPQTLLI